MQGGDTGLMRMRRFDPKLDGEIRSFSRELLKKASKSVEGRSEDGGVGQYGNYACEFYQGMRDGMETDLYSGGC
jgi:hypothetical protein